MLRNIVFGKQTRYEISENSEYTHVNDVARFGPHAFLSEGSGQRPEPGLAWPKDAEQEQLLEAYIDQLTDAWIDRYRSESSKRAITVGIELDILERLRKEKWLEVTDDILIPLEDALGIHRETNGLVSPATPQEDMDVLMFYYGCVTDALGNATKEL